MHYYGREGRNLKKLSTNGLLLDMDMLKQMSSILFINQYKNNINKFIEHFNQFENESLQNASVSDIKSYAFATLNTVDPNISFELTLEVNIKKNFFFFFTIFLF